MAQLDFPLCIYCDEEIKVVELEDNNVVIYRCYSCNIDTEVQMVTNEGLLSDSGLR